MPMTTSRLPDPEDLLGELAFRCPEIAPAICRVSVVWDPSVPTACVDWHGKIRINPNMANVALQVIAHEVMHLVGEHFVDMPAPQWDPTLANVAGDIWLNGILQDLIPALEWPEGWLYPADQTQRDMTAREIYDQIKASAKRIKVSFGAGCGVQGPTNPNGKEVGQGGPTDPSKGSGAQGPDSNPIDRATAGAVMAGIGSVLPRVDNAITPPPPKCSIPEVLREAARSSAGNSKFRATWATLGRRSSPMVPRRGKVKRGPAIVVICDVSGSMYQEIPRIREECVGLAKRAKVHLILHDCEVLFSGRVGKNEIAQKINVAGGTDFAKAFEEAAKVIKSWGGQGAIVHFTDGEVGNWPGIPAPVPCYAGVTTKACAPPPWRTRHLEK